MPRLARKNLNGSYFHIIVQGINREYIFNTNHLKESYKKFFKENLIKSNITVLAYCIMDNHAHFLLHVDEITQLTKLMQKTNTSYAKLYNKFKNRVGYVFRDRYYIQSILNHSQLLNCISYIHNNPLKANIKNKRIDYLYSSYKEYVEKKELITQKSIELIFGKTINYKDLFKKIHYKNNIEDIMDIKEDLKDSDQIISEYINSKNVSIKEVINDKDLFCNLLLKLRHEGGISLRQMSKIFSIDKNKLNKIINKNL